MELGDPTADLSRPRSLSVLVHVPIQAGEQRFSEGRAVLRWEDEGLLQDLCDVVFMSRL